MGDIASYLALFTMTELNITTKFWHYEVNEVSMLNSGSFRQI